VVEAGGPPAVSAPLQPGRAPSGRWRAWAVIGAVGWLLAAVVALRLATALPDLPNRHALPYDSAHRTMDNLEAADALGRGELGAYALRLLGRQTWPTARMALAAPLHVLGGPARALAVEQGLSLVLAALLFAVLALAAQAYARSTAGALGMLAIATPLLLGNRDLFQQAVNGMLEVPAALFTLGAASAWVASRDTQTLRPWGTALLGNLLFHTKFQYGLMFAAAVLGLEVLEAGRWRRLPGVGRVLLAEMRRPLFLGVLLVLGALTFLAFRAVAGGGIEGPGLFGVHYSLGTARVPIWLAALTLFLLVQLLLWRSRRALRTGMEPRVRYFWLWLFTPMAAWLLVPFCWRLEVLADSVRFDSHQASTRGLLDRLLYYPRAAWEGWFTPGAGWLALLLLGATAATAIRSPFVRRLVVPFATLAGVELAMLTLLSRSNFQPRLTVNLAPLLALGAAAWVPAVAAPRPRALLAVAAAAVLCAGAWTRWQRPALATTLSQGFEVVEVGDDCRDAARAFDLSYGVLVNRTTGGRAQLCSLWVELVTRERGADVVVRGNAMRPGPHRVLVLAERAEEVGPREGLVPVGDPRRFGAVWGRAYRTADPHD
jgi:hypothetical protein